MELRTLVPTTCFDLPHADLPPSGPLRVGLLGCGHVGGAVARQLLDGKGRLQTLTGADIQLVRVAVKHLTKSRPFQPSPELITDDALAVVTDLDVDIVIELIGGIQPARDLILAAISDGKDVITGNKELLAKHGTELFAAARRKGVHLLYEAAIGGAIPIVRSLRRSLAGADVTRIVGILNGTTNFILTEMEESGCDLGTALEKAQRSGYAEQDATADIEGRDTAAKACLLARLASEETDVSLSDVEGIQTVTPSDVAEAGRSGQRLRLIAEIDLTGTNAEVHVGVRRIPEQHPFFRNCGVSNAIVVETRAGGELFFAGPGAGGEATATAVIADLIEVARYRVHSAMEAG